VEDKRLIRLAFSISWFRAHKVDVSIMVQQNCLKLWNT